MNLERNIKTYYFYSTFTELLILGPIIVLYLISKGLSFTEIMLLQSIAAFAVVLFEVPTGAIADRYSRKLSVIIGLALWVVSLTMYIVGSSFLTFAIAEVIFSIGICFKSGADNAIIYDSLKLLRKESEYQRIEGAARSLALYAQAIGSVIAGFVYEKNIYLPLMISIGFVILTIFITIFFKEPPIHNKKNTRVKYLKQIIESGKYVLTHEKLKAIVLFSMVFFAFYRTGFWFFQPYMESVNIPVKYFGVIFMIFNFVAAFASKQSHVFMEKTKPRTLVSMALLLIVSFILLGLIKMWIGVAAILLQQAARGFYRPIITKYLNKHIPTDKRATILSFHSLGTNIAAAITLPLMGILKDSRDIHSTHLITAVSMIILTAVATVYMNSRLNVNKEKAPIELLKS
ncbi:MFS transporter [Alkaliphilus peptidifermentans]|uniref:Predicted arabinose efflux permease, MFS family n=1 Tax=Alkaliphilus peptidifermentans DSM 18978 TaxID=1120976 RepID=A0A1G5CE83_9FIRM|nr:MFS transporter [Alkaliphilus peptidifermentans]SCY00614.1 Predicted arabinose efflux permease, MFS family [Alkaliphilus peptidifermentans DSM 18978]